MPCFTDGGGISIKTSNGKDGRDAFIVDTNKISFAQRKNNLLRRLRLRRNAAFEAAATATSAVQYVDNANVHVGLQWGEESV